MIGNPIILSKREHNTRNRENCTGPRGQKYTRLAQELRGLFLFSSSFTLSNISDLFFCLPAISNRLIIFVPPNTGLWLALDHHDIDGEFSILQAPKPPSLINQIQLLFLLRICQFFEKENLILSAWILNPSLLQKVALSGIILATWATLSFLQRTLTNIDFVTESGSRET